MKLIKMIVSDIKKDPVANLIAPVITTVVIYTALYLLLPPLR